MLYNIYVYTYVILATGSLRAQPAEAAWWYHLRGVNLNQVNSSIHIYISLSLSLYIYIYTHIATIHKHIYIYIYIYICVNT